MPAFAKPMGRCGAFLTGGGNATPGIAFVVAMHKGLGLGLPDPHVRLRSAIRSQVVGGADPLGPHALVYVQRRGTEALS